MAVSFIGVGNPEPPTFHKSLTNFIT